MTFLTNIMLDIKIKFKYQYRSDSFANSQSWLVDLSYLPVVEGLNLIGLFQTNGELLMKLAYIRKLLIKASETAAVAQLDLLIDEALQKRGKHLWLETDRTDSGQLYVVGKNPRPAKPPRNPDRD